MIFQPKIDFLKLPPNVTPGMPPAFPRTPRARKRLFRALGRLKGRPGEACIMSKNLYKKSKIHRASSVKGPAVQTISEPISHLDNILIIRGKKTHFL